VLNDSQIRTAKPGSKILKLKDGAGLYLEVSPAGGKLWRYRFRIDGKESMCSLGDYPRVSLSEARRLRDEARALVKQGVNPAQHRKLEKARRIYEAASTFEVVAEEWFAEKSPEWSKGYRGHVRTILRSDIYPKIGKLPIKDIETPALHEVLKRIAARQAPTRAILARQVMGSVFNLAVITHRAKINPAEPLKRVIARRVVEHRRHLSRADLPDFLRRLDDYSGHVTTKIALQLLVLTAVRPGEICGAAWNEFDLEAAEWRIPAARMKMRDLHIVPLSRQALSLLRDLELLTGDGQHLFPTQGTKSKTMPVATLRNAVVKMGYGDKFSPHGARGTFSTLHNEDGKYRPDVIERQLAHAERNKVRAAYHHAQYLPERRQMMQEWADILDALRRGADVIQLSRAA
jgi:integrase